MFFSLAIRKEANNFLGIGVSMILFRSKTNVASPLWKGKERSILGIIINMEDIVYERLDYGLINPAWTPRFHNMSIKTLERITSDNAPIFIYVDKTNFSGKRLFRFENFWTQETSFKKIISQTWNYISNQPFLTWLNRVKKTLLNLNKNLIGNLESKVDNLALNISQLQSLEEKRQLHDFERDNLINLQNVYWRALKQIEIKWA